MRDLALVIVRMANVSAEASAAIRNEAVRFARDSEASWADLGVALGMSRQRAHRKYGGVVGEPKMSDYKVPVIPGLPGLADDGDDGD